jgi:hypothetical protein
VRFPLNYHISTGPEPIAPKLMRFQRAFLVLYGGLRYAHISGERIRNW